MNSFLPMNEAVFAGGMVLFSKVSTIVSSLMSVVFIMRITYLVVTVAPAGEYGALLKDTVLFLGLLSIYPILLKLAVFGISDIAAKISYIPPVYAEHSIQEFFARMFSDYPFLNVFGKIGSVIFLGIAQSVYTALISLFIASAPIFIFMGTILGLHGGIKTYFEMIIALSLWPVMWNLMGQLAVTVGAEFNHSPVSSICFWIVVQILQLLSPFFTFKLFKNLSAGIGLSEVAMIGGLAL